MPDRTLTNIAETCLDYVETADNNTPLASATNAQKRVLAQTISGALQELYRKRPEAFGGQQGATLSLPVTGNAIVTNGSTVIDLTAFGAVDFRGRSITSGSIRNQIAATVGTSPAALVEPWIGSTGTQAITVYCDAVLVGSSLFNVIGTVMLEGYGLLKPLPDRGSYIAFRDMAYNMDYGSAAPRPLMARYNGQPTSWWAEPAFISNAAGSSSQIYLRIAPLPAQVVYSISYTVSYRPKVLQTADLSDGSIALPVPGDFYDSILIPWVLQRWTGSPWFRNESARAEINRQFLVAKEILAGWSPSEQADVQLIVPVY